MQPHQTSSIQTISINPKLFQAKFERERGCYWDPSIEVADATLLHLDSGQSRNRGLVPATKPCPSLTDLHERHEKPIWSFDVQRYMRIQQLFTLNGWILHCCPSCHIPLNYQTLELTDDPTYPATTEKSACTIGVRDGKRWGPLR